MSDANFNLRRLKRLMKRYEMKYRIKFARRFTGYYAYNEREVELFFCYWGYKIFIGFKNSTFKECGNWNCERDLRNLPRKLKKYGFLRS